MKTIRQLNQEAGEIAAHVWMQAAEKMLFHGSNPMPLSKYSRENLSIFLIPDWFKAEAEKENPRWWCNDRNFKSIQSAAIAYAQQVLCVLGKYPAVTKHFSKNRNEAN